MRTPDKKLHQLIQSMSRHEKIYFKRMSARASKKKDSQYVELFDAIAAQKEYDEAALIEAFKDRDFAKQFAVMKKYLYDNVMRSLVDQRTQKELTAQLEDMKWEATILWERGMYEEALKVLKKARKKAKDFDLLSTYIDLMLTENYLIVNRKDRKEGEMNPFLEDLEESAAALYYQTTYMRLYESFAYWNRRERALRSPEKREALSQLMNHPLMLEQPDQKSFLGNLLYNTIHENYLMLNGNMEAATAYSLKNIQLYEAYPKLKEERTMNYFATMINYLNKLYRLKAGDRLKKELDRFANFKSKNERVNRYFFARFNVLQLVYCELTADVARFPQIKATVRAERKEPKHNLPDTEWRLLLYNVVKLEIMQGNYDAAQDSLLLLQEIPATERQADLQRFTELLEILIHYKLGNELLIDYLNVAAKRQMQRKNELFEYERIFSKLFHKLIHTAAYQRKSILKKYLKILEDLYEKEAAAFEYFDLLLWIRAELKACSVMELKKTNQFDQEF
jgi:hypothetical protein